MAFRKVSFSAVLWIRDILVRIRNTDLRIRIRILVFFLSGWQEANKKQFFLLKVFAYYFLKVHLRLPR